MDNKKNNEVDFLEELVSEIEKKDKLHSKKINGNILFIKEHFPVQLEELLGLVKAYFKKLGID
jgi:hypothetical protein